MPRIQILELPEGVGDRRPPFLLVVDQALPDRKVMVSGEVRGLRSEWDMLAEQIGARAVIVTPETIDIPANEVPIGPDGYPVRLAVDADLTGFREQVADAVVEARTEADSSAGAP